MKFLLILFLPFSLLGQSSYTMDTVLMGSSFSFTAIAANQRAALYASKKGLQEVIRIESVISSWNPESETSQINKAAGVKPVQVSIELYELIRRSKKISKLSDGHFDISFGAMNSLWDFSNKSLTPPSQEKINIQKGLVDYNSIVLNHKDTSIYLSKTGMQIGFGAIGKGYAANKAKGIMIEEGAYSGVVNAGGDLIAWGRKIDNSDWNVGIQDPENKNKILMSIPISNQSVVTSGNYERYFEYKGKRYCHIINPKTGWPVENLSSVTIISKNAELADALATTVFVLGRNKGLKLINQLQEVDAIIVDDENKIHFSNNIKSNYGREK